MIKQPTLLRIGILDSKRHLNKISVFLCLLLGVVAAGQEADKRTLSEADYGLWHSVFNDKISDNGEWISYKVVHKTADTLFLRNLISSKTLSFAGGDYSGFFGEYFTLMTRDNKLQILNTEKMSSDIFDSVSNYQVASGYIILQGSGEKKGMLDIRRVNGSLVQSIDGVTGFAVSPDERNVIISRKMNEHYEAGLIAFSRPGKYVVLHENVELSYQKFRWSKDGNAVVFLSINDTNGSIFYYVPDSNKLKILDCRDRQCFKEGRAIQLFPKMEISSDNKRVFFNVQHERSGPTEKEVTAQVWNTLDKVIYPERIDVEDQRMVPVQVMWEPASGRTLEITSREQLRGGSAGDRSYALTFDHLQYEPQIESDAARDIYITDFKSGRKKKILEKQDGSELHLIASAGGKYVYYFRSGHWHAYDIQNDSHRNLTKNVNTSFAPTDSDRVGEPGAFGLAGCTMGDMSVILYDQFDIWEIFPKTGKSKRLTDGRARGMVFRLIPRKSSEKLSTEMWIRTSGVYDVEQPLSIVAQAKDGSGMGYFSYCEKNGLKPLAAMEKRLLNSVQNKDKTVLSFMGETYRRPPELFVARKGVVDSIYKSNRQQEDYLWGRPQRIFYKSKSGKPLSGILYYPPGFDAGKKYPMVVKIYEQQSYQFNHYSTPTLFNAAGFNLAHLSAQGYFVLLPDIVYESEGVGMSAVYCTEAAVKAVLESEAAIDPSRIGLMGHSFGGYQTNFIISKSSMFACAVAGAAMSDLISAGHSLDTNFKSPNFFKVELGQVRVGGSLSEKKDYYINNSPIIFAHQIETPLLSWSGLDDSNVEARQSVEMYMAMRRVGKQNIMLLYEGEPHEIMKRPNMADLTKKIDAWFGHYLKGKPKAIWMLPN